MTRHSIPMLGVALAATLIAAFPAHAATEAVLYSFTGGSDGGFPQAGLIKVNNVLYGTTQSGGACNAGTVFSITPSGTETVLHSFCGGGDGFFPYGGLVNVKGTLYGTTFGGGGGPCPGGEGCGTVFAITPAGVETVVHAFQGGSDGFEVADGLIYMSKTKTLYGTTVQGGTGPCVDGCGTVFSVTTAGVETVLHSFTGGSDGAYVYAGLKAVGGTFYGTTQQGGSTDAGTVFSITPAGAEAVVYAFQGGIDAAAPQARLIDVGGALYGTSLVGGASGVGTVFEVSPQGLEKVVYSFRENNTDGTFPTGALTVAGGGLLYGTTAGGGTGSQFNCFLSPFGCGTVFSVTRQGVETVVHDFQGTPDGAGPAAGLLKADAALYGTSPYGGAHGNGCVYTVLP